MMWIVYLLLGLVAAALLIAVVRTLLIKPKVTEYRLSSEQDRVDEYARKLSVMVQKETISFRENPTIEKFLEFHSLLEELFPTVFARCEKAELDGNLLLKWKGKTNKDPILLMSHMDVVEAGGEWKYPPFSGTVAEGKVWGRGAADT